MLKRILLTATSLLAIAAATSAAQAADLTAPVYKAAVPAPVYNWTGIYIGANGGYGWGQQDPLNVITNRFDEIAINFNGGVLGGTAGAQIQLGHVVLGFEADLDWANIKGNAIVTPTIFGVPQAFSLNATTTMDRAGTARARIGYAQDNYLFYVTGGLAILGAHTDVATVTGVPCGALGILQCSGTNKRIGGTAGLGVEYGFTPNWSAKVEYLYVTAVALEVSHVNMVRAGINYRFGGI